ncbi:MAG: hypothetical protein QW292_11400 [Candidatus Parvarchaeota archaeon]
MGNESETPVMLRKHNLFYNVGGATIGNVLEWFDFGIYAFLAAVISKVIFGGIAGAILLTFLAYGIGFIFRPIGSIFFGWLGDRSGRKNALLLRVQELLLQE